MINDTGYLSVTRLIYLTVGRIAIFTARLMAGRESLVFLSVLSDDSGSPLGVERGVYHSSEIRWFFRDGPRSEVDQWFSSCAMAVTEPPRVDNYIILPRCKTAGVKIRQGNIEVKAQTQNSELLEISDRVGGFQDAWVKWSRPAANPDAVFAAPSIPECWACVEKARVLRLLTLEAESPDEIAPGSRHLHVGCQAEKTDLRVIVLDTDVEPSAHDWKKAERWWSFSLEAFGPANEVGGLLHRAASHWFGQDFPATLLAEDSMSYPEWLARLEQKAAA